MDIIHCISLKLVPPQPARSEQQFNIDALVLVVTIVRSLVPVQMACIQREKPVSQENVPSVGLLLAKRIELLSKPIGVSVCAV